MTAPLTGAADSLYRWLDVVNDVASMDVAEQMIRDVIAEAKAEEREAIAASIEKESATGGDYDSCDMWLMVEGIRDGARKP